MGIRPVCGLSKGSPCDCSIRQSKNGDAHAGTTTSSGQESNGLSPPARHYDSDSHRDTGIHRVARMVEEWILRCAIAHHSSMLTHRPGMTALSALERFAFLTTETAQSRSRTASPECRR